MSTAPVETTHLDAARTPGQDRTGGLAVVLDLRATRADSRDERVVAGQRRRLDVQARQLGRLMDRRPELRGAYAPADLALEGLLAGV
ncbi:hypothetical protein KLP28_08300 [Nocardioidaceae bacterium]|nr:hypothetical protein KLP28_08300 [Nocardioidaceae bacterium]